MKALVWHKAKDVRVETVEEPSASGYGVKIQVKWCGICGTDLHEYLAGPIFIPVGSPHPMTNEAAPLILGHEFSGQVVEVGDKVTKLKVGDRVCVEPILAPNENGRYTDEKYNLTPLLGFHGLSGGGGGFSEFTVVGEHMAHKLPDELSYEQGALVEPSAVALHAVRQSSFKAGDTAAVFGTGPIGLLVLDALKVAGASTMYAVEVAEPRKKMAEALGAIVVDPSKTDPIEEIHRLSGGGVDFAFEVTGIPKVLNKAIGSTHPGGEIVIVSIWEGEAAIQPNDIVIKERTVRGIIAYRHVYPQTMQLMKQGYFDASRMVTKRIKLDDVVAEGFEALANDKSHVKILVSPE